VASRSGKKGSGGGRRRRPNRPESASGSSRDGGSRRAPRGRSGPGPERPPYPDQLEGRNLVLSALKASGRVRVIWVDEGARRNPKIDAIRKLAEERRCGWVEVSRDALDHISRADVHNGMIGFAEPLPSQTLKGVLDDLEKRGGTPFILLLDQVQYEQNLGAILRTAACAGVDAVVIPPRRGASLTPTVQRVAMGGAEQVPVVRESPLSALASLRRRGIKVVGAEAGSGQAYDREDLRGPLALVLGGEDRGLGPKVRERCDAIVSIPMIGDEVVGSLNVSVATGVLLFERVRQLRAD